MSYLQINDVVHRLMVKHPELKDNDYKLVVAVWNKELLAQGIDIKDITGYEAFKCISAGKVSPIESITRCRRKLQEQYPQLRGQRWADRHDQETEVKKELGYEHGT